MNAGFANTSSVVLAWFVPYQLLHQLQIWFLHRKRGTASSTWFNYAEGKSGEQKLRESFFGMTLVQCVRAGSVRVMLSTVCIATPPD